MISSRTLPIVAATVAALALTAVASPAPLTTPSAGVERTSPCPKLFQYDSVNEPGVWTGNLIFKSPHELHGLWVRVIFDNPLKELTADGYDVVLTNETNTEALVKNRNLLLSTGSDINIKLNVKYDGDKFPSLLGYRINAKTVCPVAGKKPEEFFEGDDNTRDFFTSILSNSKLTAPKPAFKCGLKSGAVYPWQAAVSLKQGDNVQYICQATLISPSHVVLPAHCVTFQNEVDSIPEGLLVVTLERNQEKLGVEDVIVHRGYNPENLADDIAILKLSSVVKITDDIMPVCLSDKTIVQEVSTLVGRTIEIDGKVSNQLDIEVIPGTDTNECAESNPKLTGVLTDNTFCVLSALGKYATLGNSGSNVISTNEKVTLKGIIKLGPIANYNTNDEGTTLVAIDATKYYRWMLQVIS